MPLVSILIPCYNAEATVGEAIASAFAQTYGEVEVIVVDDGSTDGSLAVIERYADRPAFRYETGPNRGGNAARNRLLALARGEYVQFLDADDTLHPDKISACLAAMAPSVDMVYADYLELRDGELSRVDLADPGQDLVEHFIRHNVQTSLPLHRTACLRTAGGFDESLRSCQEFEFHLRLARRSWAHVRYIPVALCTLKKTPGSVSANESRVYQTLAEILSRTYQELSSDNQLNEIRADALAAQLLTCSRHLARHGLGVQARAAYRLARAISPSTSGPYRPGMRLLVSLFGPVWAERLRLTPAWLRRAGAC